MTFIYASHIDIVSTKVKKMGLGWIACRSYLVSTVEFCYPYGGIRIVRTSKLLTVKIPSLMFFRSSPISRYRSRLVLKSESVICYTIMSPSLKNMP